MNRTLLLKGSAVTIGILVSLLIAEAFLRVQNFIQLDTSSNKRRWNSVLHHGDNSFDVKTYGEGCGGDKTRILLLGDSWMEDRVLSGSIGRELARESGKCIQVVNGGTSSYAPTIYLLKARQAFEKYGKFDAVIVNVDETDIGDEWLRYRIPLKRDTEGKIVAVPFKRDLRSLFIRNGKLWAQDSPLYLVRFFRFALFHEVLVPYLEHFTFAPNHYRELMKYVFSPEAETSFSAEIDYFYGRLAEMVQGLSGMTVEPGSLYVTHHPHRRGLVDGVEEGESYLPVVSGELSRLARETGVRVLDARRHVGQIHGDGFPSDTYEQNDPFSHLAEEGATRYGKWIARQVAGNE